MPAAERRQQLLDAALTIIVRDGYRAVSIDAIARELNVTRTVVYNIFDSLDALLLELLDRHATRALGQLATTMANPEARQDGSPKHTRQIVRDLVRMVADDPRTWRPIFVSTTDTPGRVRARMERDRELVRLQFKAMLDAAIGHAERTPHADTDVLAHALLALGEYFGRLIVESQGTLDLDAMADTLAELVTAAMKEVAQ